MKEIFNFILNCHNEVWKNNSVKWVNQFFECGQRFSIKTNRSLTMDLVDRLLESSASLHNIVISAVWLSHCTWIWVQFIESSASLHNIVISAVLLSHCTWIWVQITWELSKPTQHSDLCSLVIYSQTVYTPTSQDRPLKLLVNKSTVTFVSNFVISKKQLRLLLYNELGVFTTTLDKY